MIFFFDLSIFSPILHFCLQFESFGFALSAKPTPKRSPDKLLHNEDDSLSEEDGGAPSGFFRRVGPKTGFHQGGVVFSKEKGYMLYLSPKEESKFHSFVEDVVIKKCFQTIIDFRETLVDNLFENDVELRSLGEHEFLTADQAHDLVLPVLIKRVKTDLMPEDYPDSEPHIAKKKPAPSGALPDVRFADEKFAIETSPLPFAERVEKLWTDLLLL